VRALVLILLCSCSSGQPTKVVVTDPIDRTGSPAHPVPEPSSLLLLGVGLIACYSSYRRKRK